jgi:hypothetical protein
VVGFRPELLTYPHSRQLDTEGEVMRKMNDRELKLSIIIGIVLFLAGVLDVVATT